MFARLIDRIYPHSRLLRTWRLTGGVSAQVTALEIELPGSHRLKLVVRQYSAIDIKQNPHAAENEYRLLQVLHSAGFAVPAPLYFDQANEVFESPTIVIEYVEGTPDDAPVESSEVVLELAARLAEIHRLTCADVDLSFLPRQEDRITEKLRNRPAHLDDTFDEGPIRDTLAIVWPLRKRNRPVLLHGDYWPGNTLWRAGRLVAIIDWEDAATGDPLADLGFSRLEMLWAFGHEAMYRYTQHYQSLTSIDVTDLPYWDLCAALRMAGSLYAWGLDDATESRMRDQHRFFVEQAYESVVHTPGIAAKRIQGV